MPALETILEAIDEQGLAIVVDLDAGPTQVSEFHGSSRMAAARRLAPRFSKSSTTARPSWPLAPVVSRRSWKWFIAVVSD